MDDLKFKSAIR